MASEPTMPDGNTAEAIDFLNKMFPDLPRHLVAIDLSGQVTARTFLTSRQRRNADRIEARQGKANLYFHVNALRSGFIKQEGNQGRRVSGAISARRCR